MDQTLLQRRVHVYPVLPSLGNGYREDPAEIIYISGYEDGLRKLAEERFITIWVLWPLIPLCETADREAWRLSSVTGLPPVQVRKGPAVHVHNVI
jgi:hypothetical protein